MKSKLVQIGLMALAAGVLTACGGGGGGSAALPTPQPVGNVAVAVAAAGFIGGVSNATPTVNPKMVFQLASATPVLVKNALEVNFAVVDSSGKHVPGLKLSGADATCSGSNMSFAVAKFDGSNWQSLISQRRYAVDTVVSGAQKYSVVEGTTDPVATANLEENAAESLYKYTFSTDVTKSQAFTDTIKVANNGQLAVMDGKTIHRLALQLCYVDTVTKATVKVNPYVDFTLAANGVGVPVKDSQGMFTDAQKVVDRASCNECHSDLAVHRNGGRVDPNYCVVCHNAGSKDYNTGNPIDFKLMVHKLHMGKRLTQPYQVANAVANDVIYPQNIKNCVVCHDGSATAKHKTAQGDNWRYTASKSACFSCHDDYKSGTWKTLHTFNRTINGLYPSNPDASIDSVCASCHNDAADGGIYSDGTAHAVNTTAAHAVPQWKLGENYQLNILSTMLNAAPSRSVTVRYSVSNPKTGVAYDLTSMDVSKLELMFSWNTADYAATSDRKPITTVNKLVGSNAYEMTWALPEVASGTGVVAFQGSITLDQATALQLMPNIPLGEKLASSFTVPVKNVVSYYAISDKSAVARRSVVSADKCNACHGKFLGYSDLASAAPGWGGHDGLANDPQVCVICHTGNLLLNDGATSANFKVLIHDIHKELGTAYPVWPSTSTATGILKDVPAGTKKCAMCHEGDSYKSDKGVQGTKDLTAAIVAITDHKTDGVISPKASTCYSCHSSKTDAVKNQLAIDHMVKVGSAQFGTVTQANLDVRLESCDSCHSPNSDVAPVDKAHGQ